MTAAGPVMGSRAGAMRAAASRIGVTVTEYETRTAAGEKWCTACKQWCRRDAFTADRSRGDGLKAKCQGCVKAAAINTIIKPLVLRPISRGRRYVDAREGNHKQARRRVNHLVDVGLLPRPNELPCTDCGHEWTPG